ncbi:protein of unknown function [Candidatus Filomicrobium marinum]|nr:protein of unknown function [Candidatus Filomicrobium marinum]
MAMAPDARAKAAGSALTVEVKAAQLPRAITLQRAERTKRGQKRRDRGIAIGLVLSSRSKGAALFCPLAVIPQIVED